MDLTKLSDSGNSVRPRLQGSRSPRHRRAEHQVVVVGHRASESFRSFRAATIRRVKTVVSSYAVGDAATAVISA